MVRQKQVYFALVAAKEVSSLKVVQQVEERVKLITIACKYYYSFIFDIYSAGYQAVHIQCGPSSCLPCTRFFCHRKEGGLVACPALGKEVQAVARCNKSFAVEIRIIGICIEIGLSGIGKAY